MMLTIYKRLFLGSLIGLLCVPTPQARADETLIKTGLAVVGASLVGCIMYSYLKNNYGFWLSDAELEARTHKALATLDNATRASQLKYHTDMVRLDGGQSAEVRATAMSAGCINYVDALNNARYTIRCAIKEIETCQYILRKRSDRPVFKVIGQCNTPVVNAGECDHWLQQLQSFVMSLHEYKLEVEYREMQRRLREQAEWERWRRDMAIANALTLRPRPTVVYHHMTPVVKPVTVYHHQAPSIHHVNNTVFVD